MVESSTAQEKQGVNHAASTASASRKLLVLARLLHARDLLFSQAQHYFHVNNAILRRLVQFWLVFLGFFSLSSRFFSDAWPNYNLSCRWFEFYDEASTVHDLFEIILFALKYHALMIISITTR